MGLHQPQKRMHSSGDSEEDMTGIVNGETSDREVIDHEKDRETLIHKGSEIQDHEINYFLTVTKYNELKIYMQKMAKIERIMKYGVKKQIKMTP